MRIKLLLLIVLSVSQSVSAQSWVRPGAIWHYGMDEYSSSRQGYLEIKYVGDVLVDGHMCQRLTKEWYYTFVTGPDGTLADATEDMGDEFIYSSGDTVFYRQNDEFHILYNFAAEPGDSWLAAIQDSPFMCNDSSWLQITNKGTELVGSETMTFIDVADLEGNGRGMEGRVYGRFGYFKIYPSNDFLFPSIRNCDEMTEIEPFFFSFRCYEDNEFSYKPYGSSCYSRLGLDEANEFQATVFPNPASAELTIELPASIDARFELTDMAGQLLWTGKSLGGSTTIDASSFAAGNYLLKSFVEGETTKVAKIIVTH